MNKRNENRSGYKKTKVGWIPEEWEIFSFRDVAVLRKDKIDPKSTKQNYPCVELEHLSQKTGQIIGQVNSRAKINKIIPEYLYILFHSILGKKQAFRFAKKAINQASICSSEVKKMTFNISGLEEQYCINETIKNCIQQIKLLQEKKLILQKQKKGLMQKLLTGEVRVKT